METLMRDVPEQHVVSEVRDVDQAVLEAWLPGAMSRVAAAGELLGTPAWPHLARPGDDQPVFVVIDEAIGKWIGEQGLQVAVAPRETYWTDFPAAGAPDPVFDVAFPVAARG